LKPLRSPSLPILLIVAQAIAVSPLFDDSGVLDIELDGRISALIEAVETRGHHAVSLSVDGRRYSIDASIRATATGC